MVRPFAFVALAVLVSHGSAVPTEVQTPPPVPATRKPAPKPTPKPAPPASAPAPMPEAPPPATDVRLTTAYTHGAQVSENTTYLQGPRQRVEFPGIVTLDQCDLKRSVMLNPSTKKFLVQPYPEAAPESPAAEPMDPQAAQLAQMMGTASPPPARGGVVTMTTTLSDTVERQSMFGFEARHVKTLVVKEASKTACDKSSLRVEVDAWYIDLPVSSGCARPAGPAAPPSHRDPAACTDRIETHVVGDAKLGFPVKTVTTTTTGEGDRLDVSSSSEEVTAIEIAHLDRALFDVPGDFTEANSSAEIVPAIAAGGSLSDALFGSTADGTSKAVPKTAGKIRIAVLEPVNKTDRSLPSASLRQELVAKFNKGPYEALPIAGTSPAAGDSEAARLQADYLMVTEIVEAKTSKPGRLGGVARITGGGPPKDAHDVKLQYQVFAVGAAQSAYLSGSVKASNGGFGVGSALRVAAFAGQLYMSMMMGGMGGMNPLMAMSGMGSLGPTGGGLFDPRATAMTSIFSGLAGGTPAAGGMTDGADASEAGMRDTVSEALGNSARAAMEQLTKKK